VRWLFGYRLEFNKFPYIPNGPCVMTPFILSVLCFISSERIPSMHGLQNILGQEVNTLLLNSPADSFIGTLASPLGGNGSRDEGDADEELDPELGIGPEEIVGACALAMYTSDREIAATIAASAFRWARGWIKWTSLTIPLPPTLGEVCGLLPIKRDATQEDMARIWLLCYIVDGTEALQRDSSSPPKRDPLPYCNILLPDETQPGGKECTPNDVLLAFHARLITVIRNWYHRRGGATMTDSMARLASQTNASLDMWRNALDSYNLDGGWMRHVNLFFEFARMLVNRTSARAIADKRAATSSLAMGTEAAVSFLEQCADWPQPDELVFIPPCYLNVSGPESTADRR
jgi:hypothetical protein